jgi:hypothetical protein
MKAFLKNLMILSILAITIIYGGICAGRPTYAQQVLFEDDFEEGFSKWVSVRGNDGLWEVIDGQARARIEERFTIIELVPDDAYWDETWQNYEFLLDYTPVEGTDRNLGFGFESTSTLFDVHFFRNGYEMLGFKDGTQILKETGNLALQNNQTYRVSIILDKAQITIKFDDQVIIDTINPSYDGHYGKISLKASTGNIAPTEIWFDNILVQTLGGDWILDIPLYKQNDSLWADLEYDHASTWTDQPTIRRWGCALSSMVMILHYHGIETFPDGVTEITPPTLNDWLLTQPDGYLGEGLLNWMAVSRLTWLISTKLDTPKLEYQWLNFENPQHIIADLKNNLPSIIKTAKHFLVASGFNQEETDLFVTDPYFDRNQLPEDQEILSSRHFYPSQTDLSYLLITADPTLNIEISDSVNTWQNYQENLTAINNQNPQTAGVGKTLQLYQTAKPLTSEIELQLSQPNYAPYQFQVYVYGTNGNVEILEETGFVGPTPQIYSLQYQPNQSPILQKVVENKWDHLIQETNLLYENNFLNSNWVKTDLLNLATWAKQAQPNSQTKYQQLITAHLNSYSDRITPEVKNYLLKLLSGELRSKKGCPGV